MIQTALPEVILIIGLRFMNMYRTMSAYAVNVVTTMSVKAGRRSCCLLVCLAMT